MLGIGATIKGKSESSLEWWMFQGRVSNYIVLGQAGPINAGTGDESDSERIVQNTSTVW